jgi:hypothetical protein
MNVGAAVTRATVTVLDSDNPKGIVLVTVVPLLQNLSSVERVIRGPHSKNVSLVTPSHWLGKSSTKFVQTAV